MTKPKTLREWMSDQQAPADIGFVDAVAGKRCTGLVWHEPKVCVRGYWRQCGNEATHQVGGKYGRYFCDSCRPRTDSQSDSGFSVDVSSENKDEGCKAQSAKE